MKTFNRIADAGQADYTVELGIDERAASRIIAPDINGRSVAISVERGQILRDGTLLRNDDGEILRVLAALEEVSTVRAGNLPELARLAYHLGNRHVPLEISPEGFLRYRRDHVLDDLVLRLGGTVTHERAKFSPETGAYPRHHHHHDGDSGAPRIRAINRRLPDA